MWSLACILPELRTAFPAFPGESSDDQLACIAEVLGLPPLEMYERSSRRNKHFDEQGVMVVHKTRSSGLRRKPDSRSLEVLAEARRTDAMFLDFLRSCLHWLPERRLTPEQALQHPWIDSSKKTHPLHAQHQQQQQGGDKGPVEAQSQALSGVSGQQQESGDPLEQRQSFKAAEVKIIGVAQEEQQHEQEHELEHFLRQQRILQLDEQGFGRQVVDSTESAKAAKAGKAVPAGEETAAARTSDGQSAVTALQPVPPSQPSYSTVASGAGGGVSRGMRVRAEHAQPRHAAAKEAADSTLQGQTNAKANADARSAESPGDADDAAAADVDVGIWATESAEEDFNTMNRQLRSGLEATAPVPVPSISCKVPAPIIEEQGEEVMQATAPDPALDPAPAQDQAPAPDPAPDTAKVHEPKHA